MTPLAAASRSGRRTSAFSLLEMLVVVSIIVLGGALLIPAFGKIISSTKYTSAINTVTATLGNARALAMRNGRETAVAFLYDVERDIFTLQVLELQQTGAALTDRVSAPNEHTYANAYRPAVGTVPVELPKGTGVYGLSFQIAPQSGVGSQIDNIGAHWYSGDILNGSPPDNPQRTIPWIFPRNDVRMYVRLAAGEDPWRLIGSTGQSRPEIRRSMRQSFSFFVQFSRDGSVVQTASQGGISSVNAYIEWPDLPRDLRNPTEPPFDKPNVFDPQAASTGIPLDSRTPNPEVVLRAAAQLAVVDLRRMADATGIERPWLVRSPDSAIPLQAVIDRDRSQYYSVDAVQRVNEFIDNNAEIISFNRFTGNVIRRATP